MPNLGPTELVVILALGLALLGGVIALSVYFSSRKRSRDQ